VLIAFLTLILGGLINTNTFSLQYIGGTESFAPIWVRLEKCAVQTPSQALDTYDNLYMSELRSQPAEVRDPGPRDGRPPEICHISRERISCCTS